MEDYNIIKDIKEAEIGETTIYNLVAYIEDSGSRTEIAKREVKSSNDFEGVMPFFEEVYTHGGLMERFDNDELARHFMGSITSCLLQRFNEEHPSRTFNVASPKEYLWDDNSLLFVVPFKHSDEELVIRTVPKKIQESSITIPSNFYKKHEKDYNNEDNIYSQ